MWGFTIKKAFFDFWDHLFLVIILNLGFLLLLAVPLLLPSWLYRFGVVPSAISFVVGILLLFLYSGAVSFMMKEVAYYKDPGVGEFIQFFKESWPSSLVFGGIVVLHLLRSFGSLSCVRLHEIDLWNLGIGSHFLVQRTVVPFQPLFLSSPNPGGFPGEKNPQKVFPRFLRQYWIYRVSCNGSRIDFRSLFSDSFSSAGFHRDPSLASGRVQT